MYLKRNLFNKHIISYLILCLIIYRAVYSDNKNSDEDNDGINLLSNDDMEGFCITFIIDNH